MGKLAERLRDPSRSGVYRTGRAEVVAAAAGEGRLDLAQVSLERCERKEPLLQTIAAVLGFPQWFGGNWDALEDCLGDLSWRSGDGHVLLFERFENLPSDERGVLVDVLASSAEYWAARQRPFFAVFIDPGRTLELPELYRER